MKGKVFMRSKKLICAVVAAALASTMAFASCGSDSSSTADTKTSSTASSSSAAESSSSPDSTTAATTEQKTAKDLNAIAEKVKDSLDDAVKGTMTKFDDARIERMIGVKKDLYKEAVCYVDASGASAHEIDCFEANDENAANEIKAALETRIENQKNAFKDYVPAEMTKLNDPVLVVDGNYVFLFLTNNNEAAKNAIG